MSKRDSLDLDDQLATQSTGGKKHTVDRAERTRIKPKGDTLSEYTGQIAHEAEQHPGRLEEGHETVLRPDRTQHAKDDTQTAHRRAERRAELLLAAHTARIASAQVTMLAPVKRDQARQEGLSGVARASRHLQVALQLADPVQSADLDAVANAVINCDNLIDSLDRIDDKRDAGTSALSRLVGALQRDTGYAPPVERDARAAIIIKHARSETNAAHEVVIAPLQSAALTLDEPVAELMRTMTDADRVAVNPDEQRNKTFVAAAKTAIRTLARVRHSIDDSTLAIASHEPSIQAALGEYFASAQRFVNWATRKAGVGGELEEAVSALMRSTTPIVKWSGKPPLVRAADIKRDDLVSERAHDYEALLTDRWKHVFDTQTSALQALAESKADEEPTSWEGSLFASIARIALSTVIGGPAGALGALAQTFVPDIKAGNGSNSRYGEARKGGIGNAVESLVGAALGEVLQSQSDKLSSDNARRRFFLAQAYAVADMKLLLTSTVLENAKLEARRQPDPALFLQTLIARLNKSGEQIAEAQQRRSVQDWASYRAQAAHGRDKKSGGTDMTGIGHAEPMRTFVNDFAVPDGVLELEVDVSHTTPRIAKALAAIRNDDAKVLSGLRARDVKMPTQFRMTKKGADGIPVVVIVSRNEHGVLWLRAGDDEARAALAKRYGGQASSDADILRAAARIIQTIDSHEITTVEAHE